MSFHHSIRQINPDMSRTSTIVQELTVKLGYRKRDNCYFAQIGPSIWNSHDGNYYGENAGLNNLARKVARSDLTGKHTFQVRGGAITVRQRQGSHVPMQGVVPITAPEKLDYLQERVKYEQDRIRFEADCSREELRREASPLDRYTNIRKRI